VSLETGDLTPEPGPGGVLQEMRSDGAGVVHVLAVPAPGITTHYALRGGSWERVDGAGDARKLGDVGGEVRALSSEALGREGLPSTTNGLAGTSKVELAAVGGKSLLRRTSETSWVPVLSADVFSPRLAPDFDASRIALVATFRPGAIMRSADGGLSWTSVLSLDVEPWAFTFVDSRTVIVIEGSRLSWTEF
jgi:hypothetical protein